MNKLLRLIKRNNIDFSGKIIDKSQVKLEWWSKKDNVGDYLSNIVYNWMTKDINLNKPRKKGIHLMTIGSLIGGANFDATIWGSGILDLSLVKAIYKKSWFINYDIRAVRGPLTKEVLRVAGYDCTNVAMGDPAILMPLIYKKNSDLIFKKNKYCVINHYVNENEIYKGANVICISAGTTDYKMFIDTILSSEIVISSSLHGIILAEAYGIPAIYCCKNLEHSLFKIYDYYYSTGRYNVIISRSIEEAFSLTPMDLPNLSIMQKKLIESFPVDLWK